MVVPETTARFGRAEVVPSWGARLNQPWGSAAEPCRVCACEGHPRGFSKNDVGDHTVRDGAWAPRPAAVSKVKGATATFTARRAWLLANVLTAPLVCRVTLPMRADEAR